MRERWLDTYLLRDPLAATAYLLASEMDSRWWGTTAYEKRFWRQSAKCRLSACLTKIAWKRTLVHHKRMYDMQDR